MKVLVTGCAGFIGFHLSKSLLEKGLKIIGIDNLNDYYSPSLKKNRLKVLEQFDNFGFHQVDISDKKELLKVFKNNEIDFVIHLAAQAGVRVSMENPIHTLNTNVIGFTNLIQIVTEYKIKHFVYASSSSVYGENTNIPYNSKVRTDNPISVYAASKKANELIAYSYSYNYDLPVTGIRFFTVYGPWGRPDMGYFKFVDKILKGETIELFNNGEMKRDFTFINDAISAMNLILNKIFNKEIEENYRVFNIGSNKPIKIIELVNIIQTELEMEASIDCKPAPAGDVSITCADISELENGYGYSPKYSLEAGIKSFISWYKEYYKIIEFKCEKYAK